MRSEQEMVAYALETKSELLLLIPELLIDSEELSSGSEALVDLITSLAAAQPQGSSTWDAEKALYRLRLPMNLGITSLASTCTSRSSNIAALWPHGDVLPIHVPLTCGHLEAGRRIRSCRRGALGSSG